MSLGPYTQLCLCIGQLPVDWDISQQREGLGEGESRPMDRVIMQLPGCYFSLQREDKDMFVC